MSLKQVIENTDTRAGRAFDLTIQTLIVVSLVSFSVNTLPDLNESARFWLRIIQVVTVVAFTLEYVLRIAVADRRWAFVFSFHGLVDLLAIAPFYLCAGVDLRTVRILRLFRVFWLFKLFRYTRAMRRFRDAFVEVREELVLYVIATGVLLFLASVGIYHFESEAQPDDFGSVFHCLWWAVVTLTTVGYGDACPVTVGGRIFTSFILLLGIGVIAVPTGLFAAALTKTRRNG